MANKKKTEDSLKGTFYATLSLGFVIIVIWAYCFSLFTDRM